MNIESKILLSLDLGIQNGVFLNMDHLGQPL